MSSAPDKSSSPESLTPNAPSPNAPSTDKPQPSPEIAPGANAEPAKQYRPADHESRIWNRWEASKAFHADPKRVLSGEAKPYSVVIPPPNVTAALHLGHALNNSIQDILVRAHRMKGYETLWMPGTDHAGIATQAVVEKRVQKDEKKRRTDFTREEFVAKIQAFKDEYEATITDQLKKMGCSCDWDRQRFTMDEICAKAVREAFFRLFRDGLIYRGKRLVNWDPALQTAVADDECYDEEIDAKFYYLRYPLVHPHGATTQKERTHGQLPPSDAVPVSWSELQSRGYPGAEQHADEQEAWVTVATTRPETYLADTAVAVNPRDPRAKALRGLCVELPLVGRVIPIVEDDYVVLPKTMARTEEEANDAKAEFATGFLKVTPAHDANDYDLYQRHKERMDTFAGGQDKALINMMSPDGRVSDKHGWTDLGGAHILVGKKMAEARKLVIEEFQARSVGNETLFEEAKPYRHSVKHSDRSKAIIEPYLSDQWYVKVTDPRMAAAANEALVDEQRTSAGSSSLPTASRGAGVPPASPASSTSFSSPSPSPITSTLQTQERRLPHWQRGGETYFVTFKSQGGTLSLEEQQSVLNACRHWDGERLELHAVVVMPDHAHLVLSPFEKSPGEWYSLSEITQSIKSFTSHAMNKSRGAKGQIWQDESFDRILRMSEFQDTINYVLSNPVNAKLAERWGEYKFTWVPDETLRGQMRFADRWRGDGKRKTQEEEGTEERGEGRRDVRPTQEQDSKLRFFPARYAKTYELWHDNIRDWCISRQLWWGHRIPVWYSAKNMPEDLADIYYKQVSVWERQERVRIGSQNNRFEKDTSWTVCIRDIDDVEISEFLIKFGAVQDPDVLDTWFSSSLWPISTMGWPEPDAQSSTKNLLKAFNPTSALCTAREIITLWVSRMVMMNRYFMGEDLGLGRGHGPVPFHDVFIHAMIQDGEGRKMSKSLGNGVDPLDIIASHGADAMRFTLCQMTTQTQDVRMPVVKDGISGRNTSPKFDLGRNFANKLWNAARFTSGILSGSAFSTISPSSSPLPSGTGFQTVSTLPTSSPSSFSLADRWMLSRLASAVTEADKALREYQFSNYAQVCYDLLWRDFCDWYLEAIKPTVASDPQQRAVLRAAMDTILRLLHPIMPFVTEAIFEHFSALNAEPVASLTLTPPRKAGLLCTAGWPEASSSLIDLAAETQFERLRLLITSIREVRAQHKVLSKRRVTLHATPDIEAAVQPHSAFVLAMAGMERVTTEAPPATNVKFRFESGELILSNLADAVDEGAEKTRLQRQIAELEKSVATLTGRLANPGYADRAPPAMVQQSHDQLAKAKADLAATQAALNALGGGE